jgi:aldose 1-epimerase
MNIVKNGQYIEITNNDFKVTLSSLGASIVSIYIGDDILTMTPINLEDLNRKDIYYGKTIGPITNRVKDGLIKIDNKEYRLPLNEDGVSNHSGILGLSNKLFVSNIQDNRVIFTYNQKIKDVNIIYGIAYTFNDDYQIRIDYIVRVSNKFVINLTNHTFFTLNEPNINNLSLKLDSDSYIESDKDTLLPLDIKPIIDCLDFNNEKLITKDIDNPYLTNHKSKGYDHSFILKNKNVKLSSPKYELDITSDYGCAHIYTDNYEDGVKTKNSDVNFRRSVAIEMTDNILSRPVIDKDEVYQRYIIYSFKKK